MSDWEIVRTEDVVEAIATDLPSMVFTFGIMKTKHKYWVRNKETGDERCVLAYDEEDVGNRIADGDFIDDY